MRLNESEILAGLLHPSVFVRDVVLDYLEDGQCTRAAVTRRVIDAIERYGWQEAFRFPHRLASFDVDEATADWALAQLDRTDADAPSDNMRRHLGEMLIQAPVEILVPRRESLLEHEELHLSSSGWAPNARRSFAERLDLRVSCWAKSPEECWRDLQEHCRAIADVTEFADADMQYAEMLVERIASAGHEFADRAMEILDRRPRLQGSYLDWLLGLTIILAGRLRLEAAVKPIFRHFVVDWDWYNEEISNALVRIGTPTTTNFVCQQYLRRRDYVRIYSQSVLEAVHHDGAVDGILPLAAREEDFGLRARLGVAVASHFDTRGIEPALEIYREEPDDPERLAIIERLFAHAQLAGLDQPELDQWQRQIEQSWTDFSKSQESLAALLQRFGEVRQGTLSDAPSWADAPAPDDVPYEGLDGGGGFVAQPIVRTMARVGRNDACPCGSGKKYKKCCWLREES